MCLCSDEASAEGEDLELGYAITCGESKAILLLKKFVCPGINVRCVKVGVVSTLMLQITAADGFNLSSSVSPKYEDQLISPKQFVHLSGKATLKDWKRAIRMDGIMLRSACAYCFIFLQCALGALRIEFIFSKRETQCSGMIL